MFGLDDYNYDLPPERIAQKPVQQRDRSKLLHLDRSKNLTQHYHFEDIENLLDPSDVLVVNNTKVIPARLFGQKESGGKVEILILDVAHPDNEDSGQKHIHKCLVKASKAPKPGTKLIFEGAEAKVLNVNDQFVTLCFYPKGRFIDFLNSKGHMPLPPYIKRNGNIPLYNTDDKKSYQTVYATSNGAIAAPTAGLHFTETLIERLQKKGILLINITLHVGYGTFVPVRVDDIRNHQIHSEWFDISENAANVINQAKADHRRIVAVGTTCVRTLEYATDPSNKVHSGQGQCDLFIYPGYEFKTVDALITNFHLPKSTLLMLVCAFAGRNRILKAYGHAIDNDYRFYSYGDAMLIT